MEIRKIGQADGAAAWENSLRGDHAMSSRKEMTALAPSQEVLANFALQSPFSSPGRHAALLRPLPVDVAGIAAVVQDLVLYEHVASSFYGVVIPDARRAESHVRPLERMLDALLAIDGAPLSIARPPHKLLVGICRHFTLMAVAMLRDKGVPARARCGFGAYFNPGYFEDHWVCEYWKAEEGRWALLDPQIDDVWRRKLGITHDMLDVPRDQFLTASAAWVACRKGDLDPVSFGIEFTRMRGLWFIAGNLVRDLAALNKSELLPWDVGVRNRASMRRSAIRSSRFSMSSHALLTTPTKTSMHSARATKAIPNCASHRACSML
jgi:hypothetical protein